MNRKECRCRGVGSRRANDTDMRRKEKENRKLQLELRSEKEKLNSTIIKYQREINDAQAVSATPRGPPLLPYPSLPTLATVTWEHLGGGCKVKTITRVSSDRHSHRPSALFS